MTVTVKVKGKDRVLTDPPSPHLELICGGDLNNGQVHSKSVFFCKEVMVQILNGLKKGCGDS